MPEGTSLRAPREGFFHLQLGRVPLWACWIKLKANHPTTPWEPPPLPGDTTLRAHAIGSEFNSPQRIPPAPAAASGASSGAPEGQVTPEKQPRGSATPAPQKGVTGTGPPPAQGAAMARLLALLPTLPGTHGEPAEVLAELARAATPKNESGGRGASSTLAIEAARILLSRTLRPGEDGVALRSRVRATVGDPSALVRLLASHTNPADGERALTQLARSLGVNPRINADLDALHHALLQLGRSVPTTGDGSVQAWARRLLEALASALGTRLPSLRRRLQQGLLRGRESLVLRALLRQSNLTPSARKALLHAAHGDARGRETLRNLAQAPEGGTESRQASGLQAGLEVDRLLGILREGVAGEVRATLALPDGDGWVPCHLFFSRGKDKSRSSFQEDPTDNGAWKATVGLDLSSLGPVRANLVWRREGGVEHLSLGLTAERATTVELLRVHLPALEALLAAEGAKVDLFVTHAEPNSLSLAQESARIPSPKNQAWLDLKG